MKKVVDNHSGINLSRVFFWQNPEVLVIRVVGFSSGGYKIGKKCLKINIPKGNYWRIGVMGRCQKLGIILENKVT